MLQVIVDIAEDEEVSPKVRLEAAKAGLAVGGVSTQPGSSEPNVVVNVDTGLRARVDQILEAEFTQVG